MVLVHSPVHPWPAPSRFARRPGRHWACGLAVGSRFALFDILPSGLPFLIFFPFILLTTFCFGLRAGVLCAALSSLAAWYLFIPLYYSFAIGTKNAIALGFFVLVIGIDIALIHFMHQAASQLQEEQAITAGLYEQQRTMFQELQHRVANNMQFVAALLSLQKKKVGGSPAAVAALDEARVRLETISRIHRRLYDPERLRQPVGLFLQELCGDLLGATGATNIICLVDVPPIQLDLTKLTTLSLLVVEVVTNALKHAFTPDARGTITIRLEHLDAQRLGLTIADDGRGMPTGFKPESSRSLGFRISQGLASQLGGVLTHQDGPGTVVRVEFPYTMAPVA